MDYVCVYCQSPTSGFRIKCSVCSDYELCLEVRTAQTLSLLDLTNGDDEF